MPVASFKIEDNKIIQDENNEVEIAGFLVGQGIVQVELSQRHAAPYFRYIDNLVREIKQKIFCEDK